MVWLISFLTITNIAMGYGLAVYFHRHFGTALPPRSTLRMKKVDAPAAVTVTNENASAQSPSASAPNTATAVEAPPRTSAEAVASAPATAPAEEAIGLPPVDEENVLAGIEEFRSQLAKMKVASDDSAEPVTAEEEPVGAAN